MREGAEEKEPTSWEGVKTQLDTAQEVQSIIHIKAEENEVFQDMQLIQKLRDDQKCMKKVVEGMSGIRTGNLNNIKFYCMIGHFDKKKAYLDMESPINVMSRLHYNWIMSKRLGPRRKPSNPRKISNFVGRVKGLKAFVGNFTYECDFVVLEDTTSVIDHDLGSVIFRKPFVEATGLVYNMVEGTIMFEKDKEKIMFKMPRKMEMFKHIDLIDVKTDRIPPFAIESDDDSSRKTHYSDSLDLGPEYKHDENVCRAIRSLIAMKAKRNKEEVTPNGDALRKCILKGPYTPTIVTTPAVPATENSLAVHEQTTVETVMNMTPENIAHFESEKEAIHLILTGIGYEIYSTVDACQKPSKCYNKNANPLTLVVTAQTLQDTYYESSKSHKSYAPTSKASLPTRSHANTRYNGKEIAKPITPQSESASEEDNDPEQAQRDKDMQKNLALITNYFKKIYQQQPQNFLKHQKQECRYYSKVQE
ncbi:hypothetical protein Tco_1326873 [Tanacetum coccineum]